MSGNRRSMTELQSTLARQLARRMDMCVDPVSEWVRKTGVTGFEDISRRYGGAPPHEFLPKIANEIWQDRLMKEETG